MQKKIIALAIASALVAPAAFAEVTVYGKADLSFGTTSNGTVTNTQVASNVTKVGFKGSENLGDGLAAVWQIEQQIDINQAGTNTNNNAASKNTLASRNSFLGLKSDSVGTILMGRHDTPYKLATRGLDVFADQFADNRHLMGGGYNTGGVMDARLANVVAYVSPNLNGFTGAVAYAVNSSVGTTAAGVVPGVVGTNKGSIWSLAGMYDQGPFFGSIAYQTFTATDNALAQFGVATVGGVLATGGNATGLVAGDKLSAWKIGAGYTMDAFKINGVYEKITGTGSAVANVLTRKDYSLSGVYTFGNDDVKLAYTVAGNANGVANTGAKMIGVGYDHNFSKTTSVYAMYNRIANDSGAWYGFNNAATTATQLGVTGQKTSGFMLGMKHAF